MEASIRHLRLDPDSIADGTSLFSSYGIKFSLNAMIVNIIVYSLLVLLPLIGCCTKIASKTKIIPEVVEDEDEEIKAER